jgi:hypothetical protein
MGTFPVISGSIQHRDSFDLQQPVRVNQAGDLHGRADHRLPEIFPPQFTNGLPVGVQISRVDIQFHHMIETRPHRLQTFPEVLKNLPGLNFDMRFLQKFMI